MKDTQIIANLENNSIEDYDFYACDYICIRYKISNHLYEKKIKYHVVKGYLPISPNDEKLHYTNLQNIMKNHNTPNITIFEHNNWVAPHLRAKYECEIFDICRQYDISMNSIKTIYKTKIVLPNQKPVTSPDEIPKSDKISKYLLLRQRSKKQEISPPLEISPTIIKEKRHMQFIHNIIDYFTHHNTHHSTPSVSPINSPFQVIRAKKN